MQEQWDYLILTASNDAQAQAYQRQLGLRRELGLLPQVRETRVVADLEGRRIGSGGSTLYCLATWSAAGSPRPAGRLSRRSCADCGFS
jgi:hypothetical protein